MRRSLHLVLLVALASLGGCYLSHEREIGVDAGPRDAGSRDAGSRDAHVIDAGPLVCRSVTIGATSMLDEGVTPRIAALSGGDVGVVYVRTDGSPTRVVYERLDRALTRVTGPITVATDSFTWAELAVVGGEARIAYGLAGDGASVLARVSFDGAPIAPSQRVPLLHPSIFEASGDGLLWVAFRMGDVNALELAHLDAAGELTHPPAMIPLGRYGSGHGAVARDALGGHVITYPREGPPGVRHGYVNAITAAGELGPERLLDEEDSDMAVLPVRHEGALVLVRHLDDALVLERADLTSLATIEQHGFPGLPGRPLAGALADRMVVAHATGTTLSIDDFGAELVAFERHELALPAPTSGSGASLAELPGALVLALTLIEGTSTRVFLVRVECASE